MTTPAGGIEPDRRYPIDDLLDRLPSLSRAEALEAICQYAADVTACACMPLIEENARLKVSAIFDKKDDRKTIGKCNHWPGQNECEWCRGRASTATASLEPSWFQKWKDVIEHPTERSALQPEAPCEDPFDSRDFYELMYAYRMTPRHMGSEVVAAFEAVKDFARAVNKGRT